MRARQDAKSGIDDDQYVTSGQASHYVPLSQQMIIVMFDRKEIEGFRVPLGGKLGHGHRRIRLKSLREFAEKNGIPFKEV